MRDKVFRLLRPLVQPVLAIVAALFVGALIILATGENPLAAYAVMFKGAFGSKYAILSTLTRATPIIITGLGAAIAWASNYMGIGGEGQMIMGGFVTAIVALNMPGPIWLKFLCGVVACVLTGVVYSLFSAWLLDKFKMSLAISTLMLNYAAQYITMHLVANVFQDRVTNSKLTQTYMLEEGLRLPRLVEGYDLHLGFVFAIVLVVAVWWMMNRTNFGYEARMSGFNINFCNYGGVNSKKIMYGILGLSGAICALAGASEVFGSQYRYIHNNYVSASYAWVGLNAALISNYNPFGILITSVVLSAIQTGGNALGRAMGLNVPLEISFVIQGCITLFISAKLFVQWRAKKAAPAAPAKPAAAKGGAGDAN